VQGEGRGRGAWGFPHSNRRFRVPVAGHDSLGVWPAFRGLISALTLLDYLQNVPECPKYCDFSASVLPYPLPEGIVDQRCNSDRARRDTFFGFFSATNRPERCKSIRRRIFGQWTTRAPGGSARLFHLVLVPGNRSATRPAGARLSADWYWFAPAAAQKCVLRPRKYLA
jgi:hypothetical protein